MSRAAQTRIDSWPLLAGALLCLSCEVPVASDLDESQANRTVVALREVGIVAEKTPVEGDGKRFALSVARDDAPAALRQIVEQRLLDREPPGLRGPHSEDVLVKSREQERAELASRLAGDLERTLLGLDEVVTARVHLTLAADKGRDVGTMPPRASVLLRTTGASPLSESQVKTLLQGAVSDLTADNIEVVLVQAAPPRGALPALTRVGPITLTTPSVGPFRAFALGLIGLNLVLLTICSALWWRWRKLDSEGS
jgi:type III secretion protein J